MCANASFGSKAVIRRWQSPEASRFPASAQIPPVWRARARYSDRRAATQPGRAPPTRSEL